MKVIEKYSEEINKAKEEGRNIIASMCNNEVRSLNYDVQENDNVQLLDTTTKDGHRIYVRGIMYIMAKALNKLYPKALLSINYHLSNSMFCQIDNMEVTEEFVQKLKEKMQEIIDKDLEIRKVIMTKEEAEKLAGTEIRLYMDDDEGIYWTEETLDGTRYGFRLDDSGRIYAVLECSSREAFLDLW